ncbi:Der GTPase-activating protein YihI [Vibrio stylophorae]|uniref:Der GTPase-activating protein YihI n=1 Tax=Vibrio stylophorae TaxID=659351 RepID=A0ABM8ZPS1_9VIBR|nr:Der GTPase-activating protein YihI [Vibrio stylophorae]CAH0532316.1 Der GTPase-activating protein YihI [Vibrio stylophorae]
MSRKKKSRRPGSEGPAVYREKSSSALNQEGRLRQKLRKRKGLKAGARHSEGKSQGTGMAQGQRDPRIGSKKAIPLVVATTAPELKKGGVVERQRMSTEKELQMLENDVQLNALLDRLDNGERLGAGMQAYVDEKLARIEVLMNELGLLDDEPEVVEKPAKAVKAKPASDDDLLSQFEGLDMDQFKS